MYSIETSDNNSCHRGEECKNASLNELAGYKMWRDSLFFCDFLAVPAMAAPRGFSLQNKSIRILCPFIFKLAKPYKYIDREQIHTPILEKYNE